MAIVSGRSDVRGSGYAEYTQGEHEGFQGPHGEFVPIGAGSDQCGDDQERGRGLEAGEVLDEARGDAACERLHTTQRGEKWGPWAVPTEEKSRFSRTPTISGVYTKKPSMHSVPVADSRTVPATYARLGHLEISDPPSVAGRLLRAHASLRDARVSFLRFLYCM